MVSCALSWLSFIAKHRNKIQLAAGGWWLPATYTALARCVEEAHMSSGWFACSEPSLATSLPGLHGVQGAFAIVRGGSSPCGVHPSAAQLALGSSACACFTSLRVGEATCVQLLPPHG